MRSAQPGQDHRRAAIAQPKLTDAELFAFWRATGRMGYPIGAAYRLLLLTGFGSTSARRYRGRRFTATTSSFRRRA